MRVLKVIILFLAIQVVQSIYENMKPSIGESIVKVFEKPCESFNAFIIKSVADSRDKVINDLIHETVSVLSQNCLIQVEDVDKIMKLKATKRRSAIIFIDTFESFLTFHQKLSDVNFGFSGFYLIVTQNQLFPEIKKMFKMVWTSMIFNFDVLVHEISGNVSLHTFIPFSNGSCDNMNPIKINEFNIKTRQWKTTNFFPRKFQNLQQCKLRVGVYLSTPGLDSKKVNNVTTLHGFEGNLFEEIARLLNFKMDIDVVTYGGGLILENGTATGLIQKAVQKRFDLIMSFFSLNSIRNVYLTPTKSYYIDEMIIILPSDRFLDPFLKLFYVFERELWLTLLAVCAITLLVYELVSALFSNFSKTFLSELPIPSLSLLIAFVGGSESKVPKKDFPRILLATFLLFFTVIRTVYQGGLFNILQTDIRVNQIKTIDDINNLHYTFYIVQSIDDKTKDVVNIQR